MKTNVCSLIDCTLEEWILKDKSISKSLIKRKLTKKERLKFIKTKSEFYVDLNLLNHMQIGPIYKGPSIEIIHDCEQFIAITKPENIHCHPLDYTDEDNCLSYLKSNSLFSSLSVNQNHWDRGLLYRLDYETSGVLVLCKNESLYRIIRDNFPQVAKEKIYIAIVEGEIEDSGEVESALTTSGKKIKVIDDCEPNARLTFEKIGYDSHYDYSLIKVKLLHGLRHQIRVQMASYGHPIIGDTLYGGREDKRMYLHAYEYVFNINENEFRFKSELKLFGNFLNLNSKL